MSSEDLEKYLEKMGVTARFFNFEEHKMTVDAAVNRLGVSREKIIKGIVFIDDAGLPILGIVTGDKRVSKKKLAASCDAVSARLPVNYFGFCHSNAERHASSTNCFSHSHHIRYYALVFYSPHFSRSAHAGVNFIYNHK